MFKKGLMFFVFLIALLGLLGCQTAKGAAEGIGRTAEGVGKDTTSLAGAIGKLDQWMRENMW